MARRKIDVSRSEMLQMREQGLSNADIANCLEVSVATVRRYIGPQGRHMDSLAAFATPKTAHEEQRPEPSTRAVDTLRLTYEILESAECSFAAEVDYSNESLSIGGSSIAFDKLPEFVTFVVGLAGRVSNQQKATRRAFE